MEARSPRSAPSRAVVGCGGLTWRHRKRDACCFLLTGFVRGQIGKKVCSVAPMSKRMSHVVATAVVCAVVGLVARPAPPQSATQPGLPDVQKLGPQVGSRVPDFTLRDQQGQSRTLASLIGPKGLMLVFFRSADW